MRRSLWGILVACGCGHPQDHTTTTEISCDHEVTFPSVLWLPTGSGAGDLVRGDVNGDGVPDLVTGNVFSKTVSVMLGNGDGTFRASIDSPAGDYPQYIALGDVDHDGALDVIASTWAPGGAPGFVVARGHGDGTFAAPAFYALPNPSEHIGLADLDGDGDLDVVTSTSDLYVALNKGDGTFGAPSTLPGTFGAHAFAIADVDGDHRLDIVAVNPASDTSGLSVWRGNGNGTFAARVDQPFGGGPDFLELADIDGDGTLDAITANSLDASIVVLRGRGDGSFDLLHTYVAGDAAQNHQPTTLHVADVTGDGRLDILTGVLDQLVVFPGNGDGSFQPPEASATALFAPSAIVTDDLDHDGRVDVALVNGTSVVSLLFGTGGAYPATLTFDEPGQNDQEVLAVGDLDRDGVPDLVLAGMAGASSQLGRGDGTFGMASDIAAVIGARAIALADLDHDGKLDLVAALPGTLIALRGTGDGTFATTASSAAIGGDPSALAVVDLDGDGKLDAIVADRQEGSIRVLRGSGGTAFHTASTYPAAAFATGLAVADLDGDGHLDVATAGFGQQALSILNGRTLEAGPEVALDGIAYDVAAVDLDGDGAPDLVASLTDAGQLAVLRNRGDGTFAPRATYPAGPGPTRLLVAPVRGDLAPAVFALSSMMNTLSVLMSQGDGTLGPRAAFGAGLIPAAFAVTDLDGDHVPDVALTGVLHGTVIAGACRP